MEIYVEYALIENFLVDGALLYLAMSAAKQPICLWRLALGALAGAVFALVFPLLSLPSWLAYLLKFLAGALLCVIALKRQKPWGRYALTVVLFYGLSFCFGGGLVAVFEGFGIEYFSAQGGGVVSKIPVGVLVAALALFVAFAKWGIQKIYERKRAVAHIVSCEITRGQTRIRVKGLIDTGNTARYRERAVCFVSPDVLYRLFSLEEPPHFMTVRTVSGEKKIGLYPIERITIFADGEEKALPGVYLSAAVHMVGKEYQLLLPPL